MKFYTFNQNNSGGSFDFDKNSGITHYVIIEAASKDDAIAKAERIGLYWDGCETGQDCDCCGDRWSTYCDEYDSPAIYGVPVEDAILEKDSLLWMKPNPEACIHYADGTKKWV